MRNLKLQFCKQIAAKVKDCKLILLDPNGGRSSDLVYLVTNSELLQFETSSGRSKVIAEVPGIVGAEYLALDNEICLATEVGEVLTVNPVNGAVNEGTYCDVGIKGMAWSPDQEVVTFVTKAQNVVVMTCTYDMIAEHCLAEQCSGEGQFVNVGWGKKETQFHGSEGKSAAKQKCDFSQPINIDELPQGIEISWRADGLYFVVSFVSEEWGRMFKVFNKEGVLCYTSEKMNGLQSCIVWRPSGTWIAVPHILPNKSAVALFEKNGLRHREIVLPFDLKEEAITSMKWNADSDILLIETKHLESEKQRMYLYTIGNYHWYLKQVLNFDSNDPVLTYQWDNRIGEEKCLHVICESGLYLMYRWQFVIDKFERSGIVAVIDGKKLLITDFSKAVVPPPMCSQEIEIGDYINACTINATNKTKLEICVYDASNNMHLMKVIKSKNLLNFEKPILLKIDQKQQQQQQENVPLLFGNTCWLENGWLEDHLVTSTCEGNNSKVLLISIDRESATYRVERSLTVEGIITALCNGSAELDIIFAHTANGIVHQISVKVDTLSLDKRYCSFANPVDQMRWFTSRNFDDGCLIALKTNNCLYIDADVVDNDVTSICLAGNYLAYTKLSGLYFLRLVDRQIVDERKMERGGKLITTIADDSRTVLQMPRGNLEAICPRVLSLEIVGSLLNARSYNAAMDLLRKQRINLNVICDHNMIEFVDNIDKFLSTIENPNWLNLFLSDLQNEDLTKTMYGSNYKEESRQYPEGFKIEEKVQFLCEKLCERMEQRNEARFRLPIITAYVKMGKMEKALQMIWQEKKLNNQNTTAGAINNSAEESLKYLLYLVDVNDLYNVALGTYDFGLVLFVAQKSQKDPKEFLPFLNELKTCETNYRKFKIDEHLKRYDKALSHVVQCGSEKFEEALNFIKRHELYQKALYYYGKAMREKKGNSNRTDADAKLEGEMQKCYREICLSFADYLRSNGKLDNASIMYERGGNLNQALLSAKHVLDWQRALVLARKDNMQSEQSVALSMVPSLQENGRYEEAFQLLKMYGEMDNALQCLANGKLFLKAIFEARMLKDSTLHVIESIIKPALLSYRSQMESSLLADEELFIDYKRRLLAIREKKSKQLNNIGDGGGYDNTLNVDESDLLSDTTSMYSSRYTVSSSRGTGKTFRSSKNRRKHERKILNLKPGNPFEDIALIDALYNHIMKITNQQQHVRDTCKALMEIEDDDNAAAAVQHRYKHFVSVIQDSLDEIWIPEMMTAQQCLTGPNIDYTQLKNEQRYGMLNPQKRFKPQLTFIDWEHEILR